jgi:hypothetical protein
MKLPNHQVAAVPKEKIVDYLLSASHRDGRHKAAFFNSFGFSVDNWQAMAASLLQHAADHEIATEEESPFGKRYAVDGIMDMPDGRTATIRTVWFIEAGEATARFVTSYPLRRKRDD